LAEATPVISPIEVLLLWRDNGWQEMEELLVNIWRGTSMDARLVCYGAIPTGGGPEAVGYSCALLPQCQASHIARQIPGYW
jgi:hypothetical protein